MNTCPHCGRAIVIELQKHSSAYGVPWRPMATYTDSARRFGETAETVPEFTEAFRETPARPPSKESDVWVPLLNATIAGLLFGTAIGLIVAKVTPNVRFGDDIQWTGIIIVMTISSSWLVFLARSNSTLWIREKIVNRDLDGDGRIGSIKVEASLLREDEEETHWDIERLPAPSWELLQEFAKDVLNEHTQITFSERGAARYGYSQEMFRDLRDCFVGAGWASWRNPEHHTQGADLLVGGKAILRKIADGNI